MAKEMMIVFVYDTARCCKEEDDPAEAVLYFHPAWVSLTQRLALAGQLMGVHHFLTTSFSAPSSITLQGGKFVLKKFGQYVLAVGTDRNIQDWILERRADTLESLLKLFHCDLAKILESLNNDRNRFTEKLYQMFETYLPILQYSANLFSNIPVIKLPKSASNIFLEAMQILQHCQEINGVLGGALFYNNKIVATQLGADLTKQIVIIDPYRIKAPAERIPTEFSLPVGVQLLQVYIERKQFAKLLQEANNERYYNSCLDTVTKKMLQKRTVPKSSAKEPPTTSGMKRDTSRIFTVPEEGELDSANYPPTSQYVSSSMPFAINHESPIRRKQETVKPERSKSSATVNPLTPSVCATPLKDVNRVLHENAMLICSSENDGENEGSSSVSRDNDDDIPDVVKEALRCKRLNKLRNATSKEKLMKKKDPDRKSVSLPDLTSSITQHVNDIPKTYQPELEKMLHKFNKVSPDDHDSSRRKSFTRSSRRYSRTITDPCYPVFRFDGLSVSQSMYEQYVASQCEELHNDHGNDSAIRKHHDNDGNLRPKNLPNDLTNAKLPTNDSSSSLTKDICEERVKPYDKSKQETYKRSMSLPLKPLNIVAEVQNGDDRRKSTSECGGSSCEFPQRRKLDGLQLTPLMSKLSLLADERTSGFCSRETTPSEFRDLSGFSGGAATAAATTTTTTTTNQFIRQKLESVEKEVSDGEDELDEDWINKDDSAVCLEKTELFLCGFQNMVLVLLMENGTANNPELILSLWNTCVNTLGKLESRLQQCLEPMPSTENKELYSILSVDSQWDTVQRSGLWGVTELDIVSCLHDRFMRAGSLMDIIVRTEDTVVYGNQCGGIKVFYQQAVTPSAFGTLPTPADLMGIVALKAKRRLERDHGIVLL
ncbi:uncharacterized protein LOC113561394 isoform X2 [Ooceraea biroi]|nr:uncharacterized protein LOC113561394 isoform X2 [Ooceraea biroi]